VRKFALVLLLLIVLGVLVSAQESNMYVRTVYIERIHPSAWGYRIDYRRSNSIYMATAYIPLEWFGGPTANARLVYADDRAVPFMTVYWEDGEFHHLVLVVPRHFSHTAWAPQMYDERLESRFAEAEPEFEF
jgi:hypothetical protein